MDSSTLNSTQDEPAVLLLDLPSSCLRTILLSLWLDVRDLAAFASVSSTAREFSGDNTLWREVLKKRCGPSALPGEPLPPEATRPVVLDGWVFYPGLDASQETDKSLAATCSSSSSSSCASMSVAELAERCKAQGGEAFTTAGKLVSSLRPSHSWRRTTFRPYEGTYVREDIAAVAVVDAEGGPAAPQQYIEAGHQHDQWPPVVPGWVYFPSCESPGYFHREAKDNLQALRNNGSLQALMAQVAGDSRVVAVTTAGETKTKLRPQWCWHTLPAYDQGIFVKQATVAAMGLRVPPTVPDYRSLAVHLHTYSLQLPAAQMDACWLNDSYLTLQDVSRREQEVVGRHSTVLKLNDVCWLDIGGSITGVAPGQYEVLWVMDPGQQSDHMSMYQASSFNLSATAQPLGLGEQQQRPPAADTASAAAGGGGGAAAAAGGGSGTAGASGGSASSAPGGSVSRTLTTQQLRSAGVPVGQGWVKLSGGFITVGDISRVSVRFYSHDGSWKANMRWAYLELKPCLSPAQERHKQQRGRAWRAWWDRHNNSARQRGQDGEGQQEAEGVVGYGLRLLAALRGRLEQMQ